MNQLQKFFKIEAAEEATREVWGVATAEVPDQAGETCDYEGSKPYFQAWSESFDKATGGKSLGNLRYMHQLDAVGKLTRIEFNDTDKEIRVRAKVVDDDAWRKVQEGVLTGFSQGGEYVKGPDANGRYVARPAEISLVDNPCLGVSHFTYVRADGTVELRKAVGARTKRVADEDLPASAFAYVGDPDRTDTWKLPIKFSSEEKTKSHIRNALARFDQTEGIPESERAKVKAKIEAAARACGIDSSKSFDSNELTAVVGDAMKAVFAELLSQERKTMPDDQELAKRSASLRDHVERIRDAHEKLGSHIAELHAAINGADKAQKAESKKDETEEERKKREEREERDKKRDENEKALTARIDALEKALAAKPEATKAVGTMVSRDGNAVSATVPNEFADLVRVDHVEG